jgi:hypothetical protein
LAIRGKYFGSSGETIWQFGGNNLANILVVRRKQFGGSGETIWQFERNKLTYFRKNAESMETPEKYTSAMIINVPYYAPIKFRCDS